MALLLKIFKNKEFVTLTSIIIFAAIIRVVALFNFGTYTFDDIYSVHFASYDLPKMWSYLKYELHPPLFYFIIHFWLKIFGDNEMTSRLPALIFNLASIPLVYTLGKKILNKWIGLFASFIFAASYFQIFSSIEVRMYTLLMMLALMSLNVFWLIFIEKKNYWLGFIFINILMLFTHLGSVFIVLTEWLWLIILFWQKVADKKICKKFWLGQFIVISIWLVWFVPTYLPRLTEILNQGWYFQEAKKINPAIGIFDCFFLLLKNYWLRFISGVIIFLSPFFILIWGQKNSAGQKRQNINPNWFLFAWIMPAVAVAFVSGLSLVRLFSATYIGFYFIVGYFLFLLKKKSLVFWTVTSIFVLVGFYNVFLTINTNLSRWDLANNWINQQAQNGDKILLANFVYQLQLSRYYTGNLPVGYFYPLTDDKNWDQRIVASNWLITATPENINILQKEVSGYNRIFVIYEVAPAPYSQSLIHQWLIKNNWSINKTLEPNGLFGPTVIVYSKKI